MNIDDIPEVKEGDEISASSFNALVNAIIPLVKMRAGKGIKITPADSGYVIEADATNTED